MIDGCVLDASAILCLLFAEPGAAEVERRRGRSIVGAANLTEVVAKLVERGVPAELALRSVAALNLAVVPLDRETAEAAGLMRAATRRAGLSLGDRCCLALAARTGRIAVTTDKAWASVQVGVTVEILR